MNSIEKVKHYLKEAKPGFWGKFFYYGLPYRRAIVLANIKLVFGEILTQAEQIKLAQCFYGHMAAFLQENLSLRFLNNEAIQSRVELRGKHYLLEALAEGKGALLLTGHFGNWELAPVGAFLQLRQYLRKHKLYCIRRTFSHEWIDQKVFSPFRNAGIEVIPKDHGLRQTLKALHSGDGIIVVFDQHASPGQTGVLTRFFDKPVGSYRSLVKLAKATQAPVIPISYFRLSSGKHVLEFHPEISFIHDPDPEQEQIINTQAYNDFIEAAIAEHPEQWIWLHRRWKFFTRSLTQELK